MIRWKYLIPRLTLLAFIVAFLGFGLSPLVRWVLITRGSRALGARMDLDEVRILLAQTRLHLSGVAVTNPSSPNENLFEASGMTLDMDRDALLRRQCVVREGHIRGLRFSTARAVSGELVNEDEEDSGAFQMTWFRDNWLQPAAGKLQENLKSELVTPGVCRELMQRWPEEYEQLRFRVDGLTERSRELEELVRQVRATNPLQSPQLYERLATEIAQMREELQAVPSEVRRLRTQSLQDRDSVGEAKDRDIAYLRERLRLQSLEPDDLAYYLLGDSQAQQVAEAIAWVRLARQCLPVRRMVGELQRGPGRIVYFPGMRQTPDWLFKHLTLDGEAVCGTQVVPFQGDVHGLTLEPCLYGRPVTISVRSSGSQPLSVQAILDRTGRIAHDRFVVERPSVQIPQRKLGSDDELAVSVMPGLATVQFRVELHDDALAGQLTFAQEEFGMTAELGKAYGGHPLASRLNVVLDDVDRLQVAVDLSGTLSRPRWRLRSDLGAQLAPGFQQIFQRELDAQAERLIASLERQVDVQLQQFERQVDEKNAVLLGRLDGPRDQIQQAVASLASPRNLSDKLGLPIPARVSDLPIGDWLMR